jgi:cyclohexadienyl dehydratase
VSLANIQFPTIVLERIRYHRIQNQVLPKGGEEMVSRFFGKGVKLSTLIVIFLFLLLAISQDLVRAQQIEKPALTRWKETGVIRVGWATWYPFSYRDAKTGEIKGFMIDFFRIMGEEIGMKLEFVEDSWSTFIGGLKANKFDLWYTANITVPRAMEIGYTKGYMTIPGAFFTTEEWLKAHPEIKDFWDLDRPDITIAVTKGGRTDMEITRNFKQANIKRIKGSVTEEMMELKSKRVDAAFDGALPVMKVVQEQPGLAVVPGYLGGQPVAVGVRQGDYVTIQFLNTWIDDAKRRGVFKKLYEEYLGGIPSKGFLD